MPDTRQALLELREAERHLVRALKLVGMARGRKGYLAPTITLALQDVRHAAANIEAPALSRRRGWARLARTQ